MKLSTLISTTGFIAATYVGTAAIAADDRKAPQSTTPESTQNLRGGAKAQGSTQNLIGAKAQGSTQGLIGGAKGAAIKGESRAGSQVPAVQQGIQVNPGSQAAKSGSSPKARENLRGNLTNSPEAKSAPSAKSLISKPGGFSAGQ
jgi:hypothetical protein